MRGEGIGIKQRHGAHEKSSYPNHFSPFCVHDCKDKLSLEPERLQAVFIYNIFILIICLYHSNLGDMCEKETNRRKEEKEENERRTRAMSHSVKGFKSFSSL